MVIYRERESFKVNYSATKLLLKGRIEEPRTLLHLRPSLLLYIQTETPPISPHQCAPINRKPRFLPSLRRILRVALHLLSTRKQFQSFCSLYTNRGCGPVDRWKQDQDQSGIWVLLVTALIVGLWVHGWQNKRRRNTPPPSPGGQGCTLLTAHTAIFLFSFLNNNNKFFSI